MTEFKIDYQTYPNHEGKDSVFMVNLPSTPKGCEDVPAQHKRLMNEFKISYHTRRDNKGKDSVFRVYIPSTHKGWVNMVEKDDSASPEAEEERPKISVSLRDFFN